MVADAFGKMNPVCSIMTALMTASTPLVLSVCLQTMSQNQRTLHSRPDLTRSWTSPIRGMLDSMVYSCDPQRWQSSLLRLGRRLWCQFRVPDLRSAQQERDMREQLLTSTTGVSAGSRPTCSWTLRSRASCAEREGTVIPSVRPPWLAFC